MNRIFAVAAILAALAGCSLEAPSPRAVRAGCEVPGAAPMTVVQLYFGRAVQGRGPVTDAEWAAFRARVIAREFPDGFTIYDATGQGGEGARSDAGVRETTKVLQVAVPRGADVAAKVAAVSDAYRAQFLQNSIGVVTFRACGAF